MIIDGVLPEYGEPKYIYGTSLQDIKKDNSIAVHQVATRSEWDIKYFANSELKTTPFHDTPTIFGLQQYYNQADTRTTLNEKYAPTKFGSPESCNLDSMTQIQKNKQPKHSSKDSEVSVSKTHNRFSYRLDVIKKTIIRKFKKYYRVLFKDYYDYPKYRRQTVQKQSTNVFIKAINFLAQRFGNNVIDDLELYLIAIIDVKKKYVHSGTKYSQIRLKSSEVINNFNVDRAQELLETPQFAFLFLSLMHDPKFVNQILDKKDDSELDELYLGEFKQIKQTCMSTLAKINI